MNKQSCFVSPCVAIASPFCYSFVLVLAGNNSTSFTYTPDLERENQLQEYCSLIEKKINFFSLSEVEVEKLIATAKDIEAACIFGLSSETLCVDSPENIYSFCRSIEENYGESITHFKEWRNDAFTSLQLNKTKELLQLANGLAADNNGEVASDDLADIKSCFKALQNSVYKDVFTQSWVLRLALQMLQPFKKQAYSFPALAQLGVLASNKKTLKGLLNINLEVLIAKTKYEEQLNALVEALTPEQTLIDLTELLPLGYDCMETALKRVDDTLKTIYREKIDYYKKDARIRNLINFKYSKGIEYLEPINDDLNERQQKIIKYLFSKRYLGTKELSLSFRCDRKTIQRDFNKLLKSNIVNSTGNGSALKYCINLKNNGYDMLEIHSTAVRRREDYQESLFGEEIWETIKKA